MSKQKKVLINLLKVMIYSQPKLDEKVTTVTTVYNLIITLTIM